MSSGPCGSGSKPATCGRRLAAIRGKLEIATGRLHAGIARRHDRAAARMGAVVGRLESLSPLAVLGRGYAVCWNDDRTAIIRTASSRRRQEIACTSRCTTASSVAWLKRRRTVDRPR